MKRLACALTVAACLLGARLDAQEPTPNNKKITPAPTQEMWFYLQELRRYDDPQTVIRRREETKAQQRRLRLATMKWFGFSPSRPLASPVPFMGTYSPHWVGNGRDPFQWVGGGSRTAIRVIESTKRR